MGCPDLKNAVLGLFFLLALMVQTSNIAAKPSVTVNHYKNLELSAAGGLNWLNKNSTELIISPFEIDSNRVIKTAYRGTGAWKVGIGYLVRNSQPRSLLFEVNLYQLKNVLQGNVWQFKLPQFNNYIFRAPYSSTRLIFDLKANFVTWKRVSPYFLVGVGAAWNKLAYQETAAAGIDPASALSLYKKTSVRTACDLGIGLNIVLTPTLNVSGEYIYSFLARAGAANGANNGINLRVAPVFSLQAQSFLLGLNLIF